MPIDPGTPTSAPPSADPVLERLRALMAMVLDIDVALIAGEGQPCDLPNWSSLNFVVLMAGIDKWFNISIDPQEAMSATTVCELAIIIQRQIELSGTHG